MEMTTLQTSVPEMGLIFFSGLDSGEQKLVNIYSDRSSRNANVCLFVCEA